MARLVTCGFETRAFNDYFGDGNVTCTAGGTLPTIDTSHQRSGAACAYCTGDSTHGAWVTFSAAVALGHTFSARAYINFVSFPATADECLKIQNVVLASVLGVRVTPSGTLQLWNMVANQQIGSDSAALNTGQWYRVEANCNIPASGNGGTSLFLDGALVAVDFATTNYGNTYGPSYLTVGVGTTGAHGHSAYVDDVAVNNDTGSPAGLPGPAKVVMLLPASQASRTGFTGGAGGTTNLQNGVKNTPPVGVVQTSATNSSQNKDATSNATDNFTVVTTTPTAAGVGASDVITVVQALAVHGNNTTTSRTNGVQTTANPVLAEGTGTTGTTLAATYPTGWSSIKSAVGFVPSVTLGTGTTVEFRKGTASTDYSMTCFMGVYVEYVPAFIDSRSGSIGLSGSNTETKGFVETVTGAVGVTGSVVESRPFVEVLSGALGVSGSQVEAYGYADVQTGAVGVAGSVVESHLIGADDFCVGALTLAGSVVEAHTAASSPTGSVGLGGSVLETHATEGDDACIGAVVLSGSVVESHVTSTSDYPTGTLTIAGTVVESRSTADTPTGGVVLSGSAVATPIVKVQEVTVNNGVGDYPNNTYQHITLTGVKPGSSLILYVAWRIAGTSGTSPSLTVTDNVGDSWTSVVQGSLSTNDREGIYQCARTNGGTVTVQVHSTLQANPLGGVGLWLSEWVGVGVAEAPPTVTGGSGTSVASPTVSPAKAGELVLAAATSASYAPSTSPTGPWTPVSGGRWLTNGGLPLAFLIDTDTSSRSASWTFSGSGAWGAFGASFPWVTVHNNICTGTLTLTGSVVESHVVSDTPTGRFTVQGSEVGSHSFAQFVDGRIIVSGTVQDVHAYIDTATGTIPTSGLVDEFWVIGTSYDDRPTGLMPVTGSLSELVRQSGPAGPSGDILRPSVGRVERPVSGYSSRRDYATS